MRLNVSLLIYIAGFAQMGLAIGSLMIPRVLNWHTELAKVEPIIKQIFWTYAAYILGINLCFGLISVFDYRELTNGSVLAIQVTGFIAIYWISRILIQFFYFDRKNFPTGKWCTIGEILLISLFVFLSAVYSLAFYINYVRS
jgi:hypothetical protein